MSCPVLPAETAGLRPSKQKNACPAAPCRLICLQHQAAAAPNARPPHTPRQHGQTGAGPRTSSPPAAAILFPVKINYEILNNTTLVSVVIFFLYLYCYHQVTNIFSESVFCVLARKCGNFHRKGLQRFLTLVHWYYALHPFSWIWHSISSRVWSVNSSLSSCGRHSLLADK